VPVWPTADHAPASFWRFSAILSQITGMSTANFNKRMFFTDFRQNRQKKRQANGPQQTSLIYR